MQYIPITDDKCMMVQIGKALFLDNSQIYNQRMMSIITQTIQANMPDASESERTNMMYQSIYDYWVYGTNVAEEFYFHFDKMSHDEKCQYITCRNQRLYIDHINQKEDAILLNDKYMAYQRLKSYYHREVIQLSSREDFSLFEGFITRHPVFVAKPAALGQAAGVHKVDSNEYPDKKKLFSDLLAEGTEICKGRAWRGSDAMVLEQLIDQADAMARLHPQSCNTVRITTLRIGEKIINYHPWIKIGASGHFVTSAAQGSLCAGIDAATGIIDTDGFDERGKRYEFHPQTNVKIQGFAIPFWSELIELATEVSQLFPTLKYIGWDFALTPNGWCILEGNYAGEFLWQLIYGKGMKTEFENIIGWKPKQQFWWEPDKE